MKQILVIVFSLVLFVCPLFAAEDDPTSIPEPNNAPRVENVTPKFLTFTGKLINHGPSILTAPENFTCLENFRYYERGISARKGMEKFTSNRLDSPIEMIIPFTSISDNELYLIAVNDLCDFDLFTEVDPNSRCTVTTENVLTLASMSSNEASYVYYDMSADYFTDNLECRVDVNLSAQADGAYVGLWGLANTVSEFYAIDTASGDYLALLAYRSGAAYNFTLVECNAGTLTQDAGAVSIATDYYLTIKRDESTGTYGTLYCYIYSDIARSTLVDTLSVTLTEKEDFRYLYAFSSYDISDAAASSGTISNLWLANNTEDCTARYYTDFQDGSFSASTRHETTGTGKISAVKVYDSLVVADGSDLWADAGTTVYPKMVLHEKTSGVYINAYDWIYDKTSHTISTGDVHIGYTRPFDDIIPDEDEAAQGTASGSAPELKGSHFMYWTTFTPKDRLLMHMDGDDDGVVFSDSSNAAHGNATVVATVTTETTGPKWGTASAQFDGATGTLKYADSTDWDIAESATDDWTIHLWVKHDDHAGTEAYISQYEDANNYWVLRHVHGSGIIFYLVSGGTTVITTGYGTGSEIDDTDWHHIAVCKGASIYGIYLDGVQTHYLSDDSTDTLAGLLYIGQRGSDADYFDGYIDEVVIDSDNTFSAAPVVGLTDTITVPTEASSAGSNTIEMPKISTSATTLTGRLWGGDQEMFAGAFLVQTATDDPYQDYSYWVRNSSTETYADVSEQTSTGYVYASFPYPPWQIKLFLPENNKNDTASTMTGKYWDGDSWEALSITDGTSVDSKALAQTGIITYTQPSDWKKRTIGESTEEGYPIQFDFSATIDNYVRIYKVTAIPYPDTINNEHWGLVGSYKNRLILADGDDKSIIRFSAQNLPDTFIGYDSDYAVVGGRDDWYGIVETPNGPLFAKKDGWYLMTGVNPSTFEVNKLPGVAPAVSRYGIVTISKPEGIYVVYTAADGIYMITPEGANPKISNDIKAYWESGNALEIADAMADDTVAWFDKYDNEICFAVGVGSAATTLTHDLRYNIDFQKWSIFERAFELSTGIGFVNTDNKYVTLGGAYNGYIYTLESGQDDDGTDIVCKVTRPPMLLNGMIGRNELWGTALYYSLESGATNAMTANLTSGIGSAAVDADTSATLDDTGWWYSRMSGGDTVHKGYWHVFDFTFTGRINLFGQPIWSRRTDWPRE